MKVFQLFFYYVVLVFYYVNAKAPLLSNKILNENDSETSDNDNNVCEYNGEKFTKISAAVAKIKDKGEIILLKNKIPEYNIAISDSKVVTITLSPTLESCTIEKAGLKPIFDVKNKAKLIIKSSGITLDGKKETDYNSSLIEVNNATINFAYLTIQNNLGYSAIVAKNSSTIEVSDSTIVGHVSNYGGGIFLENSEALINNTIIKGNTARYGGGIVSINSDNESILSTTVDSSEISNNEVKYEGGGIFLENVNALINNTKIKGNSANYGGGIFIKNEMYSKLNISETEIENNKAVVEGGGIYWKVDPAKNEKYLFGDIGRDVTFKNNYAALGREIAFYTPNSDFRLVDYLIEGGEEKDEVIYFRGEEGSFLRAKAPVDLNYTMNIDGLKLIIKDESISEFVLEEFNSLSGEFIPGEGNESKVIKIKSENNINFSLMLVNKTFEEFIISNTYKCIVHHLKGKTYAGYLRKNKFLTLYLNKIVEFPPIPYEKYYRWTVNKTKKVNNRKQYHILSVDSNLLIELSVEDYTFVNYIYPKGQKQDRYYYPDNQIKLRTHEDKYFSKMYQWAGWENKGNVYLDGAEFTFYGNVTFNAKLRLHSYIQLAIAVAIIGLIAYLSISLIVEKCRKKTDETRPFLEDENKNGDENSEKVSEINDI